MKNSLKIISNIGELRYDSAFSDCFGRRIITETFPAIKDFRFSDGLPCLTQAV
jgi:hypothetical protein